MSNSLPMLFFIHQKIALGNFGQIKILSICQRVRFLSGQAANRRRIFDIRYLGLVSALARGFRLR